MSDRRSAVALLALLLLGSCVALRPLPKRERELRGLWVATVNNLDWPSRRDLTPEQQRQEFVAILDRAREVGLNAIFLQVRPAADALYPSPLEPWSDYLTGELGLGPDPPYDPLAFAIEEAHKRGIELHAWFNPFRARAPAGPRVYAYGRFFWMDPGDPEAQRNTLAVIEDVVRRYDVDGVHLDDYFYPYPEKDLEFPDSETYAAYRASGGRLSRSAWRRDNINRFVRDLYRTVKSVRPEVEVGISPFGIWRPGHPEQIRGLDAYEQIYADSRLWLQKGWVDYLAPQLYWPIDRREQSFPVLLRWWTRQDRKSRGIVAGMTINRVATGRPNSVPPEEIARQLAIVRKNRRATGFILFSARTIMEDRGKINETLRNAIAR